MPFRRKLWILISLVLPIAFVVITLTRPSGPPATLVEEVPMPVLPPLAASADAGLAQGPDAGGQDAGAAAE